MTVTLTLPQARWLAQIATEEASWLGDRGEPGDEVAFGTWETADSAADALTLAVSDAVEALRANGQTTEVPL